MTPVVRWYGLHSYKQEYSVISSLNLYATFPNRVVVSSVKNIYVQMYAYVYAFTVHVHSCITMEYLIPLATLIPGLVHIYTLQPTVICSELVGSKLQHIVWFLSTCITFPLTYLLSSPMICM